MKSIKIELTWALIYTGMTMVWSLIGKLSGFHDKGIANGLLFNTLIVIPSVVIYVLAIREKKRKFYHGVMTYKQGFVCGMMLTLFVTLLGPVYPLFTNMISPGLFANSIEYAVASGMMNEAEAAEQFNLTNFIRQGLWGAIAFGAVYSAVAAIFLKSKNSVHQQYGRN